MFVNIDGRKFFSSSIKGAIRWNDKQTLCKLIEGVNLEEAKDHKGTTLLHMSVRMRVYQMIQFFIENGCDVNARDQMGTTPLLEAVKLYFFTGIKILLDAKANVALSDDKGTNALKFISTCNKIYRTELIALFADHFKKCELDTAELALLMQEAKWPIHYAIYIGNSQLIKLMLETGCDVNSSDEETDYNTALHIAVLYDHIESIQVLLQYGADTDKKNIRNESPFFIALHVPEALETFLDHRNSLLERFNSDGKIEFFEVFSDVACGVIELLLLKYKIDLTTKDSHGNTFLHCVVLNDDQNIVNLLSKTNFDVNIRNNCGDTLLHAVWL